MQAHAMPIYNNKILLILRDNVDDIPFPNCWGLIGGKALDDESPEETLLRKFEEETSVKPKNYQYMLKWPGRDTHMFFVALTEQEVKKLKIGAKGQELKFFLVDEIESLPLAGTFGKEFPNYRTLLAELSQTA